MIRKKDILKTIKALRNCRNEAKQSQNTEGYVFLCEGAVKALEWVLNYKRPRKYWCFKCGILHTNLRCPKCGNEKEHTIETHSDKTDKQ